MNSKLKIWASIFLLMNLISCQGQKTTDRTSISNNFEDDPPIYYAMPANIDSKDTSPGWQLNGQKLHVTGTVFHNDGKTPAPNILMYYYQTDPEGKYVHKEGEVRSMPPNRLGQTHGYIRGWVKTDADGRYSIRTIRPGVYPSRTEASHIHVYVKEPDLVEPYYIDNFVFNDDKLLTEQKRKRLENRGGSGVLQLVEKDGFYLGERDIILRLNIPSAQFKTIGK